MYRPLRARALPASTLGLTVLLLLGLLPVDSPSAVAATRRFGSAIETYPGYDPQTRCTPTPKPGTAKLAAYLMRTYPGTGTLGISRSCTIGGRSEHKEGRAFDWRVNYANPRQRAQAAAFLRWLTATDEHGNRHAMARRLGVMYVIWNRAIWSASTAAWRPYTGASPHRDHVHISLTWAGASARTSFWTGRVAPTPPPPPGTPAEPAPEAPPAPAPQRTRPVLDQRRVPDAVLAVGGRGRPVTTRFSLKAGTTYRLVAVGSYNYGPGSRLADATCSWDALGDAAWRARPSGSRASTLDLTMDGASRWRPANGSRRCSHRDHVYVWDHTPRRTAPVTFQVQDPEAADNAGSLTVHVLRAGARVGSYGDAARATTFPEPRPDSASRPTGPAMVDETVVVPANRSEGVLTTGALMAGTPYRISVTGVYDDGEGEADAECSRRRTAAGWRRQVSVDPHRPGADHLDLYVDGVDLMAFPTRHGRDGCDAETHSYAWPYSPRADGRARFAIWDPRPTDNTGALTVRITALG